MKKVIQIILSLTVLAAVVGTIHITQATTNTSNQIIVTGMPESAREELIKALGQ